MSNKRIAVVDGSNIAYLEQTKDGKPRTENLALVRRALKDEGFDPIVIVDAALRHDVDDPDQLESLIDEGAVRQAPAQTDGDYFILQLAEEQEAVIVSNDTFQEYRERHPWIPDRRLPLMIVRGEVYLYQEQS